MWVIPSNFQQLELHGFKYCGCQVGDNPRDSLICDYMRMITLINFWVITGINSSVVAH